MARLNHGGNKRGVLGVSLDHDRVSTKKYFAESRVHFLDGLQDVLFLAGEAGLISSERAGAGVVVRTLAFEPQDCGVVHGGVDEQRRMGGHHDLPFGLFGKFVELPLRSTGGQRVERILGLVDQEDVARQRWIIGIVRQGATCLDRVDLSLEGGFHVSLPIF